MSGQTWFLFKSFSNRKIFRFDKLNSFPEIELIFNEEISDFGILKTEKYPNGIIFNFDRRLSKKDYLAVILEASGEYLIC